MKKLILTIAALACAVGVYAAPDQAAPGQGKKRVMTQEQKDLQAAMVKKYDANGDGKIDKDERAKISAEDKAAMAKAGIMGGGKKKQQ